MDGGEGVTVFKEITQEQKRKFLKITENQTVFG